jgi:hypothetical protein
MSPLIGLLIVMLVATVGLLALPRGAMRRDPRSSGPIQFSLGWVLIAIAFAALLLGIARKGAQSHSAHGQIQYAPYVIPSETVSVPFDAAQWQDARFTNRLPMVADVLANHAKLGATREAVVACLGQGEVGHDASRETYVLQQIEPGGSDIACLRITFDSNDKLVGRELIIIPLSI